MRVFFPRVFIVHIGKNIAYTLLSHKLIGNGRVPPWGEFEVQRERGMIFSRKLKSMKFLNLILTLGTVYKEIDTSWNYTFSSQARDKGSILCMASLTIQWTEHNMIMRWFRNRKLCWHFRHQRSKIVEQTVNNALFKFKTVNLKWTKQSLPFFLFLL